VIRSVDRAARILKELAVGAPRLGVTELSERLEIAKATIYGLLRTLEEQELVEQDAETGKYKLGPAILQLGNAYLDDHRLRSRSLLWADSLATRTGETVRVGVLTGRSVLVVHHVFRPDDSVQILEVGASIPWHACALGRAIAAFLDRAHQATLLAGPHERLTGRTAVEEPALRAALAVVAHEGVAVEDQEAIVGEAEIAAPVFDHLGAVVGSVGVVGPVERLLRDGARSELVAAVKETARGLSRDMGAGRRAARSG
jgi:DNA-binding IclR family transcriptional regulator